MEEKIVSLKQQGLTLKQIAAELDVPIGKVQYAWRKWRNQQRELEAVAPVKQKRETKKAKTSVTTSRKQVASTKETINMSTSPLLKRVRRGIGSYPNGTTWTSCMRSYSLQTQCMYAGKYLIS